MSLATRCSTCGTVFRVVQDQLKISEGWVRCGRCNEVFNALEGLFDLEREAPPDWQAPAPAASGGVDLPLPVGDHDEEPRDPSLVDRIDEQIFGRAPAEAPPPKPRREKRKVELPPPGSHIDLDPPDPLEPVRYDLDGPARHRAPADIDLGHIETLEVEPEFIRRAEDLARWRRSPRRFLLAGVAALLALGLAAQWTIHFRDFVAARWPQTTSALEALCGTLGCAVSPLRRINAISVEASAMTRTGTGDAFRLTVTLRNRDALTLAMPSIDLRLTDGSGQLVARRALSPQDFRVASAQLAPQSEQSMQLVLSAGTPRVQGYTVEVFYP